MQLRFVILIVIGLTTCFSTPSAIGQIYGLVTDHTGDSLAFASVYIKGTTYGTSTNIEGSYELKMPGERGPHTLVFQYVGYASQTIEVNYQGEPVELNVQMKQVGVDLKEVVVTSAGEDPAYPIIRAAIAKRKFHRDQIEQFSCDVYMKGRIEFLDAPEKLLGQDVGDIGGILDTNRQGILYLSESQSQYHYRAPNNYKEVMISSKVSGDDRGFSFNQASDIEFNIYKNHSQMVGRAIISPIASNAMSYYRYKLEGAFLHESGVLVNKIQVIPKRNEDPVYSGYIYINDDLWNVQACELALTGASVMQPIFDSIYLNQVFVPVDQDDIWPVFQRTFRFKASLLSFKIGGNFAAVYSNYGINSAVNDVEFTKEIFKVQEGANELSTSYWDSIRPIPLTVDEEKDYVKKDSLREIWESKEFRDSVDQKGNRFTPVNLLAGYTYNNSHKRWSLTFPSPLTTIQFNPVQGFRIGLEPEFSKAFNEDFTNRLWIRGKVNYGFSDEQFRWQAGASYRFNRINLARIGFDFGKNTARDFNPIAGISPLINTSAALFQKRNFIKLYESDFLRLTYRQELFNGLFWWSTIEYNERRPLINNSDYSFKDDEVSFDANDPRNPMNYGNPSFEAHEAFTIANTFRIRFGQRYVSYPTYRFRIRSQWPDITIFHKMGVTAGNTDISFQYLGARISKSDISLGLVGRTDVSVEGGGFLAKDSLEFVDFKHFRGNEFTVYNTNRFLTSFLTLPYFAYSTDESFVAAYWQHHFDGYLLNKIPGVRKLGWSVVASVKYLNVQDLDDYGEWSVGLENLGFGIFRSLRLDYIHGVGPNTLERDKLRLGLNF